MGAEAIADRPEVEDQLLSYAEAIDEADSFIELVGVVSKYGPIEGSQRTYSRGSLIQRITLIKSLAEEGHEASPADFKRITRSLGLRHACKKLYAHQQQTDEHGSHNS